GCGCWSCAPASQHLRRERDNLEKALGAKLARHRPEDARADRLVLSVEQHRRVVVEADIAAVAAADFLGGAHDHGAGHLALLDLGVRDRLFYRDHYHVADGGVSAPRAAQHLDTL